MTRSRYYVFLLGHWRRVPRRIFWLFANRPSRIATSIIDPEGRWTGRIR